ncbi:hypothetical protein GO730_18620 [Spirosoma sp. HMF3257]|uniref:hypothetical protein n=1 Tax=Spirosoma telluris TaxID=2183553 RepID=UPI0011B9362B|nr:hypothetical protein [Spirosoma telluris]
MFTTSWGESVYAHYYNGVLFAAYQDGSNFRPQHWLVATGLMTSSVASCFAENDPHTTTNPPTNPPTGNCSYSEGQYLFTFNTEAIYAHYYNGVLFAAYQDGSNFRPQHWLVATGLMTSSVASCFAENDPHTTTNPPTNPPTGNCSYSEGQYLFTFNTEAIYAHYYNGILFAAYQDGSNFKPQHWLVATGLMTTSVASCFAENDPHTTTTNPPTGNCPYTEGQYLFTFNGTEAIYAHFYNGILFAAYQDGSNFKPQHWLVATGLMSSSVASCFAENDPHTTTNPPTSNHQYDPKVLIGRSARTSANCQFSDCGPSLLPVGNGIRILTPATEPDNFSLNRFWESLNYFNTFYNITATDFRSETTYSPFFENFSEFSFSGSDDYNESNGWMLAFKDLGAQRTDGVTAGPPMPFLLYIINTLVR